MLEWTKTNLSIYHGTDSIYMKSKALYNMLYIIKEGGKTLVLSQAPRFFGMGNDAIYPLERLR